MEFGKGDGRVHVSRLEHVLDRGGGGGWGWGAAMRRLCCDGRQTCTEHTVSLRCWTSAACSKNCSVCLHLLQPQSSKCSNK